VQLTTKNLFPGCLFAIARFDLPNGGNGRLISTKQIVVFSQFKAQS